MSEKYIFALKNGKKGEQYMVWKVFVIVAVLIGIALTGLGISLIVKRNGRFPETHIGRNKAMKARGIHCANTTDRLERENYRTVKNS